MALRFKQEWSYLKSLAEASSLTKEQTKFLFALREVEGWSEESQTVGKATEGNEFNVNFVRGTTYEAQAKAAISSIRLNTQRWYKRILDKGHCSFAYFFYYEGGPLGSGWRRVKASGWDTKIESILKEIENES